MEVAKRRRMPIS